MNPEGAPEIMSAYAAYATDAAKAIRDSLGSPATDEEIAADVESMWKFESELAKVSQLLFNARFFK